jgi:hypothetical protein
MDKVQKLSSNESYLMVTGGFYLGITRQGREVDHSLQTSAPKVREYLYAPPIRLQGVALS